MGVCLDKLLPNSNYMFMQEHKLWKFSDIELAKKYLHKCGCNAHFGPARRTAQQGVSVDDHTTLCANSHDSLRAYKPLCVGHGVHACLRPMRICHTCPTCVSKWHYVAMWLKRTSIVHCY